jgi:hypothetical protein
MGASRRFPAWACERKWKERIRRQEEEVERAAKENEEKEKAEKEKIEADKEKVGAEGAEVGDTGSDDKTDDVGTPVPKTKKRKSRVFKEDKEGGETGKPQRKPRGKIRCKAKELVAMEEGGKI